MAFQLRLVKEAAEGKAGPGRYGRGYELVIAVEDWWFEADRDSAAALLRRSARGRLDRSALQLGPYSSLRSLRGPFAFAGHDAVTVAVTKGSQRAALHRDIAHK